MLKLYNYIFLTIYSHNYTTHSFFFLKRLQNLLYFWDTETGDWIKLNRLEVTSLKKGDTWFERALYKLSLYNFFQMACNKKLVDTWRAKKSYHVIKGSSRHAERVHWGWKGNDSIARISVCKIEAGQHRCQSKAFNGIWKRQLNRISEHSQHWTFNKCYIISSFLSLFLPWKLAANQSLKLKFCLDVPVKNAWCGLMQGVSSSTMANGG